MAFEKVRSGFPGLDEMLDHIRLGDNVVWQVAGLEDYRFFAERFARQAAGDKRRLIYIRFADHAPVLPGDCGAKIFTLDPSEGFERFTVSVHKIIAAEGREAFYVFDSLSDLQVAWSTDLMMGNFFRVTCPYLFELDTVAFFPVLRAHHSFEALARIRETTQILLDVYTGPSGRYIHPIKVWKRYLPDMFLPHRVDPDGAFPALSDSIDVSAFYRLLHEKSGFQGRQNLDSYERFFLSARDKYQNGEFDAATAEKLVRSMLTRDPKMESLILSSFDPEDYFFIKDRMIGTGAVGGKACGMLLARKLLEKHLPEYRAKLEPHDSFFIGTDVFYSYLVENGCWKLKISQKSGRGYFASGEKLRERILAGSFSDEIRSQFRRMLDYFGQIPIIVRSSSFLEDGFGSAFAGKYESVFCAGSGSADDRLADFENAVKTVYASTMDRSALEYRKSRGLDKNDEQMAILVQRVSGTRFGDFFMPCAAGTGFSYSVYRWSDELDPEAGLLRLVAGMGTRAVDRTAGDYPRLVNLDRPECTTFSSARQMFSCSQKTLDLIDLSTHEFRSVGAFSLLPSLPVWYKNLIAERDYEAEECYLAQGDRREIAHVTCGGIVKNRALVGMLRDILKTLERHYGSPVDIEYTLNFSGSGDFVVNLLQCRPLAVWKSAGSAPLPKLPEKQVLFSVRNTFMGSASRLKIDYALFVDSRGYYALPYMRKSLAVQAVDKVNTRFKSGGKNLMLIVPGRIGTSSPELGIPVRFANVSGFRAICEYADRESGYTPELSYGSHMFQDLVESNVFYAAIMENENTLSWNKNFWNDKKDLFPSLCPDLSPLFGIVRVYKTDSLNLYADIQNRAALCGE